MKCPRCKSEKFSKNGIVKNKQRYICNECKYNFTVEKKSTVKDSLTKRTALEMYLEGLGFRSIGRLLKTSHVAIYQWIKEFGERMNQIRSKDKIEVVEMDEMHTYICKKKTTVGYGLLLIDMGKNSLVAFSEHGEPKRVKNFGKK